VFRLVGELEEGGFLQRDASNFYSLGIKLWEMGLLTPVHGRLRELAMPFLLNLQFVTRETVQLAVCDGLDAVYIEKLTSEVDRSAQSRIGARIPLHATAVGQVLLAFSDQHLVDAILDLPLTKYTESTITTQRYLLKELEQVRLRGYAYSRGEYLAGSVAIAAPVFVNGEVEAALGVVNYEQREDIEACVADVLKAGDSFSRLLEELGSTVIT